MRIVTDNTKLNTMLDASIESITWRQDSYTTGGIVESDERVDEGRKLYWPWCWPRSFVVKPLLDLGETGRVRRFLDFWKNCQQDDGSWLHCYDIRDGSANPESAKETDNVAYMLCHIFDFYNTTKDIDWLKDNWLMVKRAVEYLMSLYNNDYKLIWGYEECCIPDGADFPAGYSIQINAICAKGLERASELAEAIGERETAEDWLEHSKSVVEGINERLWDPVDGRYIFGITEEGKPRNGMLLWHNLMPAFINSTWDEKAELTFRYLKNICYDRDPKIPNSWWNSDYSSTLNVSDSPCFNYSGVGVVIGAMPFVAELLLRAGYLKLAAEHVDVFTRYTSDTNNLIPEHINTIHPGRLGNYNNYPEPYYFVDSGNLLHLSWFMSMVTAMVGRDDVNKNEIWPRLPKNIRLLNVDDLETLDGKLSYRYEIADRGCRMDIKPSKSMAITLYLESNGGENVFVDGKQTTDFRRVETYGREVDYIELTVTCSGATEILVN